MGSAGAPPAVFGAPAENTGRGKAFIATHASRGSDVSGEAPETAGGGARAPQCTPSAFPAPADASRIASPRVAFVSTNSISQGEQVGILWGDLFQRFHLKIHFAHRTFQWMSEARGKAHVHVVIIGFGAFDVTAKSIYEYIDDKITVVPATNISPYLVEGSDVAIPSRSTPLCEVPPCEYGNKPTDGGHLIVEEEDQQQFLAENPGAKKYLRPLLCAEEYLHSIPRWCLWLVDAEPADLRAISGIKQRIEAVRDFSLASKKAPTREKALQPALFAEIRQPRSRYIVVPRHSSENRRYIPFGYFEPDVILHDSCSCIPDATPFHFGILSSVIHMAWMRTVCGRLESRYRYSSNIVYNNFPWPTPTPEQRAKVETAARAVLAAREPHLPPRGMSTLADLYDPLTMPAALAKAHAELDRAVERCYRAEPFRSDRERVEHLFALYEKLTTLFLTPKTKARARKPVPLYRQKRKELPTGQATPESEAAAAHFHTPMGKEDSPPYRAGGRTAGLPDASAE